MEFKNVNRRIISIDERLVSHNAYLHLFYSHNAFVNLLTLPRLGFFVKSCKRPSDFDELYLRNKKRFFNSVLIFGKLNEFRNE